MNKASELLGLLCISEEESGSAIPAPSTPTPAEKLKKMNIPYEKEVNNGVVVNKNITPLIYLKMTHRKHPVSSVRHKSISSIFNIHKGDISKMAHLYHLMFDKAEFDMGAVNLERANDINYVGIFHTVEDAKKYIASQEFAKDLEITPGERKELATQKKWSSKDLGLKDQVTN